MKKNSLFRRGIAWLMMSCVFTVFAVPAAGKNGPPGNEMFTLTEKGVGKVPIILFAKAPPMTRQAANELASCIEKVSGTKPEVIEGLPSPVPEHAIWVGYQPKLKELFPGIDFDFKNREEILIASNGKHLVIAGRDRWDPAAMEFRKTKHGIDFYGQQEYGTANAIYTFIQDYLGVRWLWPGPTGEDIIRKDTIAFKPFEYRYAPPLRLRRGILYWCDRTKQRGRLTADWGRQQRLFLDSSGNLVQQDHAFDTWWDRFHEKHPEYFALQPNGKRTNGYPSPKKVKMCMSNPEVWDVWLKDVEEQLKKDPAKTCFSAAENDNISDGHCVCPACEAWDAPDAPRRIFVWKGMSQPHVALSDRQIRFANQLARKLKEKYPDKNYTVMTYAYGFSMPPPRNVKPDKNVIVFFVGHLFNDMNGTDRWSLDNETFAQQINGWAATGANLVFRPNLPGNAGLYFGIPDVAFGRVMDCFHVMASKHCEGFQLAAFWNFWPTQGPLYYMLAQLAWDPSRDGRKILEDYYQRGFGPAAAELKAYWEFMEQTRNRMVDSKLSFREAYDSAFFRKAEDLLAKADELVKGKDGIYAKRITHVRNGLVFTKLMIDILELREKYKSKETNDTEKPVIAEKLREDMKQVKSMIKGDFNYCIGPNPFLLERMLAETEMMLAGNNGKSKKNRTPVTSNSQKKKEKK